MTREFAVISFLAFIAGTAFGQSTNAKPRFEAADVHPSAPTRSFKVYMTGGVLRGERYDLRKATMLDLIARAWDVDPDTVAGGPSWLNLDRFDIAAKAPEGTPREMLRLMLQDLLEERFGLVVKKDIRPVPAYVLSGGKGTPKLKKASGAGDRGCRGVPRAQKRDSGPNRVFACHGESMAAFAKDLRDLVGDYLTSPVFDSTGLKGEWDFEIKWTDRVQLAGAGSDGISIFDAIDKQLGLKLDYRKAPEPVLAVERVNEKPSANLPGTEGALPAPPVPEFEVADVKLSPPGTQANIDILPGGRIVVQGQTMKDLIKLAWDIDSDEMVAGGPKWWDTVRYTIIAKSSSAVGPGDGEYDADDLLPMLRNLLAERFQLRTHMEDRPLQAYTLVAVKPKLRKADPSNRAGCREAAAQAKDPRNTNPALSQLVSCTNVTMEQFAAQLQPMAGEYLQAPVKDGTRIQGAYDIQLSFSTAGFLRGSVAGPRAWNRKGAPEPTGGLSLFDAIRRQLGLKLEMQKRPVPVLVIDHVEEKPVGN